MFDNCPVGLKINAAIFTKPPDNVTHHSNPLFDLCHSSCQAVQIDKRLKPGVRVTVQMDNQSESESPSILINLTF